MLNYFKKFIRHSMVYALGNALNRAAAFILIPLYTRMLSPAEYGTLEMFYVTANILGTLIGMNFAHGTLRFYFESENREYRKQVISTSMIFSLSFSVIVLSAMMYFRSALSGLIFKTSGYEGFFVLVFGIVFFTISREISFAYLRAKESPGLYVGIAAVQLIAQITFNLYMVVVLRLGVKGILIGNMLSLGVTWAILMIMTFSYCGFNFNVQRFREIISYSLPLVLSGSVFIIVNMSDRIFLNEYKDLLSVGIYALALRFSIGIKEMVIDPFTLNYGQSRFAIMKQENAAQIYRNVLTYFTLVLVLLALLIAIYSKEILIIVSSSEYIGAGLVVPLVLLTAVLTGVSYVLQTGILISKKTRNIFIINILSAVVTLVLNYILIPAFGYFGAAAASGVCGIFTCWLTHLLAEKVYKIGYEIGRLVKIFLAAGLILLTGMYAQEYMSAYAAAALKAMLMFAFPVVLFGLGFFRKNEIRKAGDVYLSVVKRFSRQQVS